VEEKLRSGGPPPVPERRESQDEPVLTKAEWEDQHRLSLERMTISSGIKLRSREQFFEFVLVAITLIGGIWLVREGKDCQGFLSSLRPGCPGHTLCLSRKDMRMSSCDSRTTYLNGVVFSECTPKRQQPAQALGPSLPGF
jgi:hypothetical protein